MTVPATDTRQEEEQETATTTAPVASDASSSSPPVEKSTVEEKASEDESPLEKTTSRIENYPTGVKLALILLSIYLSVLLVALDRTIIATALPKITDQFQSFADVGWVRPDLP